MNGNYLRTEIEFIRGRARFTWNGKIYGPAFATIEAAQEALARCVAITGLDPRHADERRLAALGIEMIGGGT